MSYEVELKFAVDDREALVARLESMGAGAGRSVRQEDRYFNHPSRDFALTDEAFRIRRDGDHNCLTYKGPKVDATTKTRREIEVPFEPGDDARSKTAEMLRRLGFREVRTVAKTRVEYELSIESMVVHAVVDDVDGVGTYAELETIADESSLEKAKLTLTALAEKLGLTRSERRSYLELLLSSIQA
jgi:adenylate cyclase class 2